MKPQKIKNATFNLTYWLGIVVLGVTLGLILQFARAWTEPSQAPPGGNVGAPINTGSQTQTKSGSLNVNGSGYGIYASDTGTGRYTYLGGSGAAGYFNGNGGWAGYFTGPAYSDQYFFAQYFRDTNNWDRYVDPSGTSQLSDLIVDNLKTGNSIQSFGLISTPWLCLNGDCRNSWPEGGGGGGGGGAVSSGLYGWCDSNGCDSRSPAVLNYESGKCECQCPTGYETVKIGTAYTFQPSFVCDNPAAPCSDQFKETGAFYSCLKQ